jgi:WhiB family redox-sensing transcriptional regulator
VIQWRSRNRHDPYNAVLPKFSDFLAEVNRLMPWANRAACAAEDPELFYPSVEGRADITKRSTAQAKAICARCPVRTECLDYAIRFDEPDGVWGGKTRIERVKMSKRLSGTRSA